MSDPFGPPPGLDINENRQTIIWVAVLVPYGLALITVILRLLSRKLARSGSWFDDWLIIAAMAVATGLVAGTITSLNEGLGQHIWVFPTDEIGQHSQDILLGLFELDNMYYGCYGMVKMAILAFYWRAMKHIFIQRIVFLGNMAIVLWAGVAITMTVLECDPVSGFWIDPLEANCPIPRIPVHVSLSVVSAVMNFLILLLPVPYFIAAHHHSLIQSIVLIILFGTGLFVCVASVLRTLAVANTSVTDVDILFNLSSAWAWSVVEVQAAIIAANLPTLGPVVAKLAPSVAEQFISTTQSGSTETFDIPPPAMTERKQQSAKKERRARRERRRGSSGAGLNKRSDELTMPARVRSNSVDLGYYEADEKNRSIHASVSSWCDDIERTQRVRSLEDAITEWERSAGGPSTTWEHSHPTDWEKALLRDENTIRPLHSATQQPRLPSLVGDPATLDPKILEMAASDREAGGTDTPPNVQWLRAYEATTADEAAVPNYYPISTRPATFGKDHPLRSNAPNARPIGRTLSSRSESSSPSQDNSIDGGVIINEPLQRLRHERRRTLSYSPDYLRQSTRSPDVEFARQMTMTKVRMPSSARSRSPTPPPPIPPPRNRKPLTPTDGIHVRTDVDIDYERWSQIRY